MENRRVMTSNTLKVDNSSHCTTPSDRADHQVVSVKVGCFHINPANARGRRLYMLQMLVLAFVPHAALIMQNCTIMAQLSNTLAWSLYLDSEVSSGLYAGDTVVSLQEERLMLSKHLFTTSLQPAMSRRNNTSHLHLAFLWSDRNMSLLPPPAVPPHPRQAL